MQTSARLAERYVDVAETVRIVPASEVRKYSPSQPRDSRGRWTTTGSTEPDYRGMHRAPHNDGETPRLGRSANGDTMYPADLLTLPVSTAVRYYGMGDPAYEADEADAIEVIRRASRADAKGKTGGYTTVYRAVPDTVKSNKINPGDWVTHSRRYAVEHGEGNLGEGVGYKLLSEMVPLNHLYTDGNSLLEWGYDPTPDSKVQKYNPQQPRDERGRWTDGAVVLSGKDADKALWGRTTTPSEDQAFEMHLAAAVEVGKLVTGLSGDELAAYYRRNERFANLPVVFEGEDTTGMAGELAGLAGRRWNQNPDFDLAMNMGFAARALGLSTASGRRSRSYTLDRLRPEDEKVATALTRAQYEYTQSRLAGMPPVRLYRGLKGWQHGSNDLESWTTRASTARRFAGRTGTVIEADVPAERIFSVAGFGPGAVSEREVLVLGGTTKAIGKRYDPNQPRDERGRWTSGGGMGTAPAGVESLGIETDAPELAELFMNIPKAHRTPEAMTRVDSPFNDNTIPVEYAPAGLLPSNVVGVYSIGSQRIGQPGTFRKGSIAINPLQATPGSIKGRVFAAHEYGHALDNIAFGHNGGKYGSASSLRPKSRAIIESMQGSPAFERIRTHENSRYYTTPTEMFARGYAQWVSARAGDSAATAWLEGRWDQWTAEEFKPIAQKYDDLFRSNGLID